MKVISVKKLVAKTYKKLGLSDEWKEYVGDVDAAFTMIIWGASFNGKSSFLNAFVAELARITTVLYVALEESFSTTSKMKAMENGLSEMKNLRYANHETNFASLMEYLGKKRSPRIVIIDSLQYIAMTYVDYKRLKETFPHKTFIFISHSEGKLPDGKTGKKIRYDAPIKVFVSDFIAIIDSRFGGHKNYVIWEQEAKKRWGTKEFKKHLNR
ncbi:MAG TPA: hypothetical protein VIQ00_02875 [Chitinophagaceae bacterium]|jgi:Predicted ATP-dependent serine protease